MKCCIYDYAAIYPGLHCLPKYSFRIQHYIMDYGLKFSMELSIDSEQLGYTVKPVKNLHSKIDKTKILTTIGSLMKI